MVELAEEGRRFHDEVSPLLGAIQEAAEDAAASKATVRGRLKVNADPWFARVVLAPRLPEFLGRHPQLLGSLLRSMARWSSAALAACEAGQGLFQSLELGLELWLQNGRLVQVLGDWAE